MSADLAGARVALLEARLESELADLVRRCGGEPYSVPSVVEEPIDATADVAELVAALRNGAVEVVVFLTGVGCRELLAAADKLGEGAMLRARLAGATVVCRGPKPAAALRAAGLRCSVQTHAPYTTMELVTAMASLPLADRGVAIIEYGDRNAPLATVLRSRGAIVRTIQLYEWKLPADIAPLTALIDEIIGGRVDAVAFTSQVQVRHLFAVAARDGQELDLARSLQLRTVVGSIGPTCTSALDAIGVMPHVEASPPKMRPLVAAIADFLATLRSESTHQATHHATPE